MILFALMALNATAQKPRWVGNTPKELNQTYRFVEVVSKGSSIEAARIEALNVLAQNQQFRNAVMMNMNIENLSNIDQVRTNGDLQETIHDKITVQMEVKGQTFRLQGYTIDEYVAGYRYGQYSLHTLFMVAVTDNPVFDHTYLSTSYGAAPVAMSVIPGMGQIYKGSVTKGILMLASEAALGAGIVLCENQRADYKNKMKEQPRFAKDYNTKANNWETARNVCIGAAAAVWVYNIVDAAVARGSRRVKVKRAGGGGFAMVPMYSSEGSGVSLVYRF